MWSGVRCPGRFERDFARPAKWIAHMRRCVRESGEMHYVGVEVCESGEMHFVGVVRAEPATQPAPQHSRGLSGPRSGDG